MGRKCPRAQDKRWSVIEKLEFQKRFILRASPHLVLSPYSVENESERYKEKMVKKKAA